MHVRNSLYTQSDFHTFRNCITIQTTKPIITLSFANLGDSLTHHNKAKFSSKDADNDTTSSNCAVTYKGAWWYKECHVSNLNGQYLEGPHESFADGINWEAWKGYSYSLKHVEMKIRVKEQYLLVLIYILFSLLAIIIIYVSYPYGLLFFGLKGKIKQKHTIIKFTIQENIFQIIGIPILIFLCIYITAPFPV